jgi:hypothetical protein
MSKLIHSCKKVIPIILERMFAAPNCITSLRRLSFILAIYFDLANVFYQTTLFCNSPVR